MRPGRVFFQYKPQIEFVPIQLQQFLSTHRNIVSLASPSSSGGSSVIVRSSIDDIYKNLAIEETLLSGLQLQKGHYVLFLYVNAPCVVVGRNQNIFSEVSMRQAMEDGVRVARRSSGGGAVYHDQGNLCLSFFTHRSEYAPEKTIQLVRAALSTAFGIPPAALSTTKRHDLFFTNKKISGSAMRVQKDIAYHHCTLLLSSSRNSLGKYLHSEAECVFFKTGAVSSVRSPVTTIENELKFENNSSCFWTNNRQSSFSVAPLSYPYSSVAEVHDRSLLLQPLRFMTYMAFFFHTYCTHLMLLDEQGITDFIDNLYSRSISSSSSSVEHGPHLDHRKPLCFNIDVEEAIRSFKFVQEAPSKKMASGSAGNSTSLLDEVERTKGKNWLWNMPRFESVVCISALQLQTVLLLLLSPSTSSAWGKRCLEISTLALASPSPNRDTITSNCTSIACSDSRKPNTCVRNDVVEELLNYLFPCGNEEGELLFVRSVVHHRKTCEIDCFRGHIKNGFGEKIERTDEERPKKNASPSQTFDTSKLTYLKFFSALFSSVIKGENADIPLDKIEGWKPNENHLYEVPIGWKEVWNGEKNEFQGQTGYTKCIQSNDFKEILDLPASCHVSCAAVLVEAVIILWKRKNHFDFSSAGQSEAT